MPGGVDPEQTNKKIKKGQVWIEVECTRCGQMNGDGTSGRRAMKKNGKGRKKKEEEKKTGEVGVTVGEGTKKKESE